MNLAVEKSAIQSAVYDHPEFAAFVTGMNEHFAAWRRKTAKILKALEPGCHPKEVIARLAEDLLAHYTGKPLINPYAVYQHLLDYWAETMQDDCYLISAEGWKAETARIIEKDKKGKEKDKGWTCDLVPKPLIVARYFEKEQADIDRIASDLETVAAKLAGLEEEHGGEEGAYSSLDKVSAAEINKRLKELKDEADSAEEIAALQAWLKVSEQEGDLKKRLRRVESALDAKAYAQYSTLSESEIKQLVVDSKWLTALNARIHSEMERISQNLSQRVRQLSERYQDCMPVIVHRAAESASKVDCHLRRMGFEWN